MKRGLINVHWILKNTAHWQPQGEGFPWTKGTQMETEMGGECLRGEEMKTGNITDCFREVSEGEDGRQLEKEVESREALFLTKWVK